MRGKRQDVGPTGRIRMMLVLAGRISSVCIWQSLLLAGLAAAQSSGGTLRVEVDLATVDVVAIDKKGKPVRNLTKESFRLFQDGKKLEILSFDAVSDESLFEDSFGFTGSSQRGKVVLILFDDSTIKPRHLERSRNAALRYVEEYMQPGDWFGVAVYGQSFKLVQNLTQDPDKVLATVRQPAVSHAKTSFEEERRLRREVGTQRQGSSQLGTPRDPFDRKRRDSARERLRALRALRVLRHVASSLARVRGRKSVLMFGEEFSIPMDIQQTMKSAIFQAQKGNVSFYTVDVKGLEGGFEVGRSTGPAGQRSSLDHLSPPAGPLNLQTLPLWVSSFQGDRGGGAQGGQGQGGPQGGGQGGNRPNPNNQPNSSPGEPSDPNDGFGNRGVSDFERFDSDQHQLPDILRTLAEQTGGRHVFRTNDLERGLDQVELELSNYYVLGFQPNPVRNNSQPVRLTIKTSLKGVKLKYPPIYAPDGSAHRLAGSKNERSLMKAIASPTVISQIPVAFQSFYFYESPEVARVSIAASVNRSGLPAKNGGPGRETELEVMGVAYAQDGSVAAKFSEIVEAFSTPGEAPVPNPTLLFRNDFRLQPGKYSLKLAVATRKGKRVGTAQQVLLVPEMPPQGLSSSSLVVTQEMAKLPPLVQELQAKLLKTRDPLIHNGLQILAPVQNLASREQPLSLFYKIYNLSADEPSRQLRARVRWTDELGQTSEFPAQLDRIAESTGQGEVAIAFNLPLDDLAPGTYSLSVETSDLSTGQSVTGQTEVVIH